MKNTLLNARFYSRHTVTVAQELLGKVIVTSQPGSPEITAGRIVETEAYRADDPASHSCKGETPRTSIMFGDPGFAYVYLIYGMYRMLNFVTEPKTYPGAVLIRALEPLEGHNIMAIRRKNSKHLCNGPGRLCQSLGIEMSDNGESLRGPRLAVYDDGYSVVKFEASSRIGITKGLDKQWRFYIPDNAHVSPVRGTQ